MKNIKQYNQSQQTPHRINPEIHSYTFCMSKTEKILKYQKRHDQFHMILRADFSLKTKETNKQKNDARKQWNAMLKVLKEKKNQSRILQPVKPFFINKSLDKQKLRECVATKSVL